MENTDTRATAFGRVLGALMAARGIPAEPGQMKTLFDRSGLDGEKYLAHAAGEEVAELGPLTGLDREMGLSDKEAQTLAVAYVYEQDEIGDLIRRGDTFNDAYALVLDRGEGLYPVAKKRILDLLGAERDAAWAEAKRLKAALGVEAGG